MTPLLAYRAPPESIAASMSESFSKTRKNTTLVGWYSGHFHPTAELRGGPLPLALFAGSLGGGLGTRSVDRAASPGVEGHVVVGNGSAALRADLPRFDRALGRVVSAGAEQL